MLLCPVRKRSLCHFLHFSSSPGYQWRVKLCHFAKWTKTEAKEKAEYAVRLSRWKSSAIIEQQQPGQSNPLIAVISKSVEIAVCCCFRSAVIATNMSKCIAQCHTGARSQQQKIVRSIAIRAWLFSLLVSAAAISSLTPCDDALTFRTRKTSHLLPLGERSRNSEFPNTQWAAVNQSTDNILAFQCSFRVSNSLRICNPAI